MGLCHGKYLESNRNTLVEQPTSAKEQQPASRKEQPPTSAKSVKKKKKKNEIVADASENSSNSDNILNDNNNNNKSSSNNDSANDSINNSADDRKDGLLGPSKSPFRIPASPFRYSPFRSPFWPTTPRNNSSANSTPRHFFKRPFPPPSPAKHIQSALHKRHGVVKPPSEGTIHEDPAEEKPLDKNFGYLKIFSSKYELEHEIGRGHFGHTMQAKFKKGDLKGVSVAVKIISKAKMTTAIAIEDVRREVKILKALTGHNNLVQFYDACEDNMNVYIVMEGGKYSEEDAKVVVIQILNIVAFCHLQGVVHRDLKPENFLFTTKDENSQLKAIDFGLSDFVKPDERLNDIVGSAYYVAPEVLHRSYNTEADIWSIGVITYILLCGSRPFWARTESGIFRAVLKTEPNYEELPWPSVSLEAKDFVKRLLNKDRHKRMTAAQALAHPWIHGIHKIPLDILVYRLVKSYLCSSNLRKAALKALSKTLCEDDMVYLKAQFMLLQPPKSGRVSLENFRSALTRNGTAAMKESRVHDILSSMEALRSRKMDFREFCAAAISVPQLEGRDEWEQQAQNAYQEFEKDGSNRTVAVEDLARELRIPSTVPAHVVLHDWVRQSDGKLSFLGFTNLLRGVAPRPMLRPQ